MGSWSVFTLNEWRQLAWRLPLTWSRPLADRKPFSERREWSLLHGHLACNQDRYTASHPVLNGAERGRMKSRLGLFRHEVSDFTRKRRLWRLNFIMIIVFLSSFSEDETQMSVPCRLMTDVMKTSDVRTITLCKQTIYSSVVHIVKEPCLLIRWIKNCELLASGPTICASDEAQRG